MNGCTILACKCKNKYQDEKYGAGQRVHNYMRGKESGKPQARCTVCCTIKDVK